MQSMVEGPCAVGPSTIESAFNGPPPRRFATERSYSPL